MLYGSGTDQTGVCLVIQEIVYPSVHMIYFPWDRLQRLQEPTEDFDRGPFDAMVRYAHPIPVELWTHHRAMAFCRREYPRIAEILTGATRPVMLVDLLRWLIVYHFGGVFWQFYTEPLAEMNRFLPSRHKSVRLFTEFDLSEKQCWDAAAHSIRAGVPEEPVRILIQVFSARPRATFLRKTIDLIVKRMENTRPQCDYDILYITGNAAASAAYALFGQNDPDVERMDRGTSRRWIHWKYRGTWRTDTSLSTKKQEAGMSPPQASVPAQDLTGGNRFRRLKGTAYRRLGVHDHEKLMRSREDLRGSHSLSSDPAVRATFHELGIASLFEIPCGRWIPPAESLPFLYLGGDPDRGVVRANRLACARGAERFLHVLPLYDRIPHVDALLCVGYLEWLPFREGLRVLNNFLNSHARWFGLLTHPLLLENWDTALGDSRPLNLCCSPFSLPPPEHCTKVAWPITARVDASLGIWQRSSLLSWAQRGNQTT